MKMEVQSLSSASQAAKRLDYWESQGMITSKEADDMYQMYLSAHKSGSMIPNVYNTLGTMR